VPNGNKYRHSVETEANEKTAPLVEQTKDFLRDPLSR